VFCYFPYYIQSEIREQGALNIILEIREQGALNIWEINGTRCFEYDMELREHSALNMIWEIIIREQ
jgi:hypothetical protein